MLSAPAIQALAKEEVDRLAKQRYWEPAFSQGTVHLTVLVYRLPERTEAYYIVGFQIGAQQTGRLTLNASTGEVGEVTGVDDPQDSLPTLMARNDVVSRLREGILTLKTTAERPFDQTKATLESDMVWKPCDQSRTPFLPFYVAHDGMNEVFVRADGAAFRELTDEGAG